MTHVELMYYIEGCKERNKQIMQQSITQAYLIATLSATSFLNPKNMPKLENLLKDKNEEMTDEQMLRNARALCNSFK